MEFCPSFNLARACSFADIPTNKVYREVQPIHHPVFDPVARHLALLMVGTTLPAEGQASSDLVVSLHEVAVPRVTRRCTVQLALLQNVKVAQWTMSGEQRLITLSCRLILRCTSL